MGNESTVKIPEEFEAKEEAIENGIIIRFQKRNII